MSIHHNFSVKSDFRLLENCRPPNYHYDSQLVKMKKWNLNGNVVTTSLPSDFDDLPYLVGRGNNQLFLILILFHFISFHFISFHFISFHFISFHFISFHFISFYFILFYFILFHFISFYFILFYFILFYFILFYFILFYFILFIFFYFNLFYFIFQNDCCKGKGQPPLVTRRLNIVRTLLRLLILIKLAFDNTLLKIYYIDLIIQLLEHKNSNGLHYAKVRLVEEEAGSRRWTKVAKIFMTFCEKKKINKSVAKNIDFWNWC